MIQPYLSSTAEFDPTRALAWRNANFALRKSIEVFEHVLGLFTTSNEICMAVTTVAIISSCPVCITFGIGGAITETAKFAIVLAIDISEQVYKETVDSQDGDAAADQDSAVYENVITIHGNVIATHNILKNVEIFILQFYPNFTVHDTHESPFKLNVVEGHVDRHFLSYK